MLTVMLWSRSSLRSASASPLVSCEREEIKEQPKNEHCLCVPYRVLRRTVHTVAHKSTERGSRGDEHDMALEYCHGAAAFKRRRERAYSPKRRHQLHTSLNQIQAAEVVEVHLVPECRSGNAQEVARQSQTSAWDNHIRHTEGSLYSKYAVHELRGSGTRGGSDHLINVFLATNVAHKCQDLLRTCRKSLPKILDNASSGLTHLQSPLCVFDTWCVRRGD